MKKYLLMGMVLAVIVIGFFVYRTYQNRQTAAESNYQTVEIRIDSLVDMVGSTGTVRANQTATLMWQTSGQIEDITVEPGDLVKKDQVLARLAQTSLPQNIINAKADVVDAQRALDDLYESDLKSTQAYQAYIAAQQEMEDAKDQRSSKDYQRASDAVIEEAHANYILALDAVKDAEKDYNNVAHLYEEDPERARAQTKLAAARKERDDQKARLNYLLSMPDELEISQADARLEVAQADLADAAREWERLKEGCDDDDKAAAEARLASIQSLLHMAHIKAPFSGTLTGSCSKTGDLVQAGTSSFRIDDLSHIFVDVEISEVDINRIKSGQETTITFDAILNKEYNGRVVEVASVGTTDQGIVNFPVTIELLDGDESVMPGMTAAVNIITTRLDGVMVVPNRAFKEVEGKRVLYLLRDGEEEAVPVTLGAVSDVYSQVISDELHEGDLIILNPMIESVQKGASIGF